MALLYEISSQFTQHSVLCSHVGEYVITRPIHEPVPAGALKGVAEAEGRAELRRGWLALSEGRVPEAQGML